MAIKHPIQHIGLLGGTFNPIHNGHLELATYVQRRLGLDVMQLLPNHVPPHKETPMVNAKHRLAMVNAAIANYTQLDVNPIELARSQPSYSVDTLLTIRQQQPDNAIYFVMGMDSFASLSQWSRWQQLLDLCHLVICQRPGDAIPTKGIEAELLAQHQKSGISELNGKLSGHILCLNNPLWPVSSTQIRQHLSHGTIDLDLLPESVVQYIANHQLYRQ
ncbi:nicotinate-nucleotide adenylyltransferase [Neiella marina]|uniref:Probable nicotinate-nucleotide adenylyltransferase n=1 Tax=Neiella holothuriorum TaxID=2870530 RepID=A0ABS7EEQ2_9GAMM|nr:nicotinate-nucleotide adenylyltransferase [Neiella holothuriorum]MBW8190715.1 nicotinate-nucleotide adenylyltransferase [Neiella holothuriorum]